MKKAVLIIGILILFSLIFCLIDSIPDEKDYKEKIIGEFYNYNDHFNHFKMISNDGKIQIYQYRDDNGQVSNIKLIVTSEGRIYFD